MSEPVSIEQIIQDAGGPSAIVRASREAGGEITRDAVYKWRLTGVPDRHWSILMSLTDYGPDHLYQANCRARDARQGLREAAE
jgi:hypothetical protein